MPQGFQADFLGILTRTLFFSLTTPSDLNGSAAPSLPPFDENYFEWIDLLESIASARGDFTMLELGAGYGRWLVRAAFAARWFGNLQCKLVGVEAEPTHFEWMKQHFEDNGLNPEDHALIRGAISKQDGMTWFIVGDPGAWYGQRMALPVDLWQWARQRLRRFFMKVSRDSEREEGSPLYDFEKVRTIGLSTLLRSLKKVDLIDLDVQGSELEVLRAASEELNSKARRVHIGTHNRKVESGLRTLFLRSDWLNIFDFPSRSESETRWGLIKFLDGVQSWVNPNLATQ